MKKIIQLFIVFCLPSLFLQSAFAKSIGKDGDNTFILGLSTFYYSSNNDDGVTTSQSNNTIFDVKGGYVTSKGLFLGGLFTSRTDDLNGSSSTGGGQTAASIGYYGSSGIHFVGHYVFSATLGGSTALYGKGTGIQADFGYLSSVTSNFFIGVDLSYRSLTYKEFAGIPLTNSFKRTELFPMLSVMFTLM